MKNFLILLFGLLTFSEGTVLNTPGPYTFRHIYKNTPQKLGQNATNKTSNPCQIKLFDKDRENYNQIMQGFVQGLYRNPPDGCPLCSKLGLIAGTLQENFITLEDKRNEWVDIAAVFKLDFFTQINRLLSLLVLFATTAISIDMLVKDPKIVGMLDLIIKRFDPSYIEDMQNSVLDNIAQLSILWTLAPGASCHGLGVRAGTTIKRLMKISFETIDELKYANFTNTSNSTNTTTLINMKPDVFLYN